jgi:hypothetical protein
MIRGDLATMGMAGDASGPPSLFMDRGVGWFLPWLGALDRPGLDNQATVGGSRERTKAREPPKRLPSSNVGKVRPASSRSRPWPWPVPPPTAHVRFFLTSTLIPPSPVCSHSRPTFTSNTLGRRVPLWRLPVHSFFPQQTESSCSITFIINAKSHHLPTDTYSPASKFQSTYQPT